MTAIHLGDIAAHLRDVACAIDRYSPEELQSELEQAATDIEGHLPRQTEEPASP